MYQHKNTGQNMIKYRADTLLLRLLEVNPAFIPRRIIIATNELNVANICAYKQKQGHFFIHYELGIYDYKLFQSIL